MSAIGSIVRATLGDFASMLRLGNDAAEDAIKSERAAKAVLTRRSLFAAAGAMASGALISVPAPLPGLPKLWRVTFNMSAAAGGFSVPAWSDIAAQWIAVRASEVSP